MKKIYSFLLSAAFCFTFASAQNKCGTMDVLDHHIQQNPAVATQIQQAEQQALDWRNLHNIAKKTGNVYTIPVVVHVVYTSATENISDAQIYSQIQALNEDYRRLNADTSLTRTDFSNVVTDMEIEFCLATTDPNGMSTTGITRTSGNPGFLGAYDPFTENVKSNASGGKDPWPTDQYLNIWVCKLFSGLLGYAQFPGEDSLTDGVVITYTAFGTMGTAAAPSDKGRTATHEVGHWLGLRHIWGDGDCTVDDFVNDTPVSDDSNYGCPATENSCVDSPTDLPDMIENYMDYSDDACMNSFTLGQKARVLSFLTTDRAGLLTSPGCLMPISIDRFEPADVRFEVYPNPSDGFFMLETDLRPDNVQRMIVKDILGKTVWASETWKTSLDLSGMSSGIYFLTVITKEGIISRKIQVLGKE